MAMVQPETDPIRMVDERDFPAHPEAAQRDRLRIAGSACDRMHGWYPAVEAARMAIGGSPRMTPVA